LTRGERPDERILRPEIADILIAYYREQAAPKSNERQRR